MKNQNIGFHASKITCALLTAAMCAAFAGCSQSESPSSAAAETTAGTTAEKSSSSEASTAAPESGKYDLKSLHKVNADSDDEFAGIWKISSGSGSQYEDFYYLFDGEGMSSLITGSAGYCGEYTYATDNGAKALTVKLVFGLNGSYTYEFSGSDSVTLTSTDGGTVTTLTKTEELDFVPSGSENAQTDDKLVGCWSSGTGEYLCFDSNGVMYQNLYDTMFTYSTYTASDGKIASTYTTASKSSTDNYTYSVDGDKLTLDDSTYSRISFDEMK